jgi:hypothetical protein
VAKLRAAPAVRIGYNSAGRDGNAMFKLDGKYYGAVSDLHDWNASVAHVIESTASNIQGAYTSEYTMAGTELDYSLGSAEPRAGPQGAANANALATFATSTGSAHTRHAPSACRPPGRRREARPDDPQEGT